MKESTNRGIIFFISYFFVLVTMVDDLLALASDLLALSDDLLALASDLLILSDDLLALASDLFELTHKPTRCI